VRERLGKAIAVVYLVEVLAATHALAEAEALALLAQMEAEVMAATVEQV
jgi:hypothetical protein